MALGATLFALMNFFARLASSSASWASVGAVRAFVGALVAVAVARMRRAPLVVNDKRAMFWRSLLGTISMVATFYALSSRTLSLGDTATLLNFTPVFLAILAPIFLRERTSFGIAFAIALSLAGVMLILRPAFVFGADGPPSASSHTTAFVALLAALSASIAMMLLRKMGQKESAEAIALHFSIFATVTMIVFAVFDPRVPTARDAFFMIAAGVCAGFGQIAMTRAYALEAAARVGGIGYVAVVVSALLGAIALHERPDVIAIAGMLLVIAGGLLASFTRRAS
jgi:drug/metabolite transporter (DMT)-like permease